MAFCKGGLTVVRKLYNEIDAPLENILDTVVAFTGTIKSLEANPTVDAIVKLIPQGTQIETWLNTAIDKIVVPGVGIIKSAAEKLGEWLNGKTELESNGNLLKLASTMTAVAHGEVHEEHFYDSAVQLQVISNKP